VPYATPGEATILQQNTDRQAAIVNLVREARAFYGGSLTAAMRDLAGWRRLVRKVARIVREMPLWRLQRIGAEQMNFLYENRGDGGVIQLLPGIAYCFRKFHALISDLVQGAWVRYVRHVVCPIVATDGQRSIRRSYTPTELVRIAREALAGTRARFRHSTSPVYIRQILDITYWAPPDSNVLTCAA